ncbi:hypothetical protein HII30_04475 [Paenibacillus lemnae]|uniref:Uncharacterized protein n=1 Tax=Paenibacillus lemnae TaxID=1330551 RepID=A0A848M476_PAELE|nr:hypothetical protein [Paenibacillus lemnae]
MELSLRCIAGCSASRTRILKGGAGGSKQTQKLAGCGTKLYTTSLTRD